jgi:hypothetical protein
MSMTLPKEPPVYSGPLVVTCSACAAQREHPPFESHVVLNGNTNLYCDKCREVQIHFVGIPERKLQPTERKRRARS